MADDNSPQMDTSLDLMFRQNSFTAAFNNNDETNVDMYLMQDNTVNSNPIKINDCMSGTMGSPRTVHTCMTGKGNEFTLNDPTVEGTYKPSESFET